MNDAIADPLAEAPGGEQEEQITDERLVGYNPTDEEMSEEAEALGKAEVTPPEEPEEELAPEDPDDVPAGPSPEEEEYEPAGEEQTIVEGSGEGEEEPEPAPALEPEPEVTGESSPDPDLVPRVNSKSKNRLYLVFEEEKKSKVRYSHPPECPSIESRNGDNAVRAAYRQIAEARGEDLAITLVVVASRGFQPRTIKPRARNLPPALVID